MLSSFHRLQRIAVICGVVFLLNACGGVSNEPVPKALLAENVLFLVPLSMLAAVTNSCALTLRRDGPGGRNGPCKALGALVVTGSHSSETLLAA